MRSLGYVHSGEADFEGSLGLPEDCTVTFQFSRDWTMARRAHVEGSVSLQLALGVAWLRRQWVPSGRPVVKSISPIQENSMKNGHGRKRR